MESGDLSTEYELFFKKKKGVHQRTIASNITELQILVEHSRYCLLI